MRIISYILVGFFMFGCGNPDRPSKPDNLISKDKMSDIIYDVFMLNSAKGINKSILEQNGVLPQEYVYEKYGIDSLQFAKSNDYYSYDTKIYEGIMANVKQKLEREKIINEALVAREEKTKDSLNDLKLKKKDSMSKKTIDVIPRRQKISSELDSTDLNKQKKLKPKIFGKDEN